MDFVFHAVSSAALARGLGERRRPALLLAALVGLGPDILTMTGIYNAPRGFAYGLGHSLLTQAAICLGICLVNPRIAFGGLLHTVLDMFTHTYGTRHALFPFGAWRMFRGWTWYEWDGIWAWALLWIILLLFILRFRHTGRRGLRARGAQP